MAGETVSPTCLRQEEWTALVRLGKSSELVPLPLRSRTGRVTPSERHALLLAEGEALQFGAIERMKKNGAVIHRWPRELIDALRTSWSEVFAEEAAKDPMFRKVYDSYTSFRESYKIWRDLAYVN